MEGRRAFEVGEVDGESEGVEVEEGQHLLGLGRHVHDRQALVVGQQGVGLVAAEQLDQSLGSTRGSTRLPRKVAKCRAVKPSSVGALTQEGRLSGGK